MRNINTEPPAASDRLTRYTMRVVGVTLAVFAVFFLAKDYPASALADGFFAVGTLLGVVTAAAGWMPAPDEKIVPQRQPAYQAEGVRSR